MPPPGKTLYSANVSEYLYALSTDLTKKKKEAKKKKTATATIDPLKRKAY